MGSSVRQPARQEMKESVRVHEKTFYNHFVYIQAWSRLRICEDRVARVQLKMESAGVWRGGPGARPVGCNRGEIDRYKTVSSWAKW